MFKLIIFDQGGVVFTNGTKKFVTDLAVRYGYPYEKVNDVIDGAIGTAYRESKISRDEFWKQTVAALELKESADDLEKEWIDGYELIPGTKEIIAKLRTTHKVVYLSDNVRERAEKLNEKFGFLSWFDDGIFSHEVGVRKPNLKIYQLALEKGNANASESIFIDDKLELLAPATVLGITTILFESAKQLEVDLKKLGVLV